MKRLVMAAAALCGANALAMPTKAELSAAQRLVAELMAPAMDAFKGATTKEKSAAAVKVGDASTEFVQSAETEAAKFLLLKGAVNFYARGEAYDKAADALAALQREVKDVPPAVIAEIAGKATGRISETKAPRLYALYRSAKLQLHAAEEAKALAAKLKKVKSDALQRKYAEALAVSGDWKAAYAEFAKVENAKLREVAAAEAAGKAKCAESGEFWWTYTPALNDADDFFKSHAAAFYRQALDKGEITGLKKNLVEQRMKGIAVEVLSNRGIAAAPSKQDGLYCVVDLSGGSDARQYPVSFLNEIPKGGWTDEYKTTKLALRKVKAGSDSEGRYSITKDFFIGVHMVTVKQWQLVMGTIPEGASANLSGTLTMVKWNDFRGLSDKERNGLRAPADDSFLGRLAARTNGMGFDLPTEAQNKLAYNDGVKAKQYVDGGAWERCLDWIGELKGQDPIGSVGGGKCANRKGNGKAGICSYNASPDRGYRLYLAASPVCSATACSGSDSGSNRATGKACQEKGSVMKLKLKNNRELEFVRCPPGSFYLQTSYNGFKAQKVSITRPFWIMKTPLVGRDVENYVSMRGNSGGDRMIEPYTSALGDFIDELNVETSKLLPNGYVVRLASLAEFEYAFHAGCEDDDKPYGNPARFYGKDCFHEKNAWGLSNFCVHEKILDRILPESVTWKSKAAYVGELPKDLPKQDPFFWSDSPDSKYCKRGMWSLKLTADDAKTRWGFVRLVVGPDLVSEWKAKHGKK